MRSADATGNLARRRRWITVFVIAWLCVFHYESLRYSYLQPLAGCPLPKVQCLFPPAGWIMFYRVDASEVRAEVYGLRDGAPTQLNPHAIFPVRNIGYDNIRRNVLISVLDPAVGPPFCRYLRRKFPADPTFVIVYAAYPSIVAQPSQVWRQGVYRCGSD